MPADKPETVRSPGTLALGDALGQSQALTSLLQRLQESQARLAALRERLPEALRDQVRAGPLDEAGWSILVPNGAAASKLRHLLPELDAALRKQGWPALPLRIRVQAR
jgi:hypothetical protein